jgi:hypothetical protein
VTPPAAAAPIAMLLSVAIVAGCGFGPGPASEGEAILTVTRDYGSEPLVSAREDDPASSETVIRFLDREAEITTRYGGGFVQSIEGLAGGERAGRSLDWFFYVNGLESPIGGAEVRVHGGDRIWWDYRDWTAAMRVPAVVGQWPEPFEQTSTGDGALPVRVECAGARATCERAAERLGDAGVEARVGGLDADPAGSPVALRVLVGPWSRVRNDPAAAQIEDGPGASGVFARFDGDRGPYGLVALDAEGNEAFRAEHGGLVAAVREGDDPPTWLVTGTDPAAVRLAAGLLDDADLRDRYAVAVEASGKPIGLPVTDPAGTAG